MNLIQNALFADLEMYMKSQSFREHYPILGTEMKESRRCNLPITTTHTAYVDTDYIRRQ